MCIYPTCCIGPYRKLNGTEWLELTNASPGNPAFRVGTIWRILGNSRQLGDEPLEDGLPSRAEGQGTKSIVPAMEGLIGEIWGPASRIGMYTGLIRISVDENWTIDILVDFDYRSSQRMGEWGQVQLFPDVPALGQLGVDLSSNEYKHQSQM